MDDELKKDLNEVMGTISETWKGILLSVGLVSGLFELLAEKKSLSLDEICKINSYDKHKLDQWFYYMESIHIVQKENNRYSLTPKGQLFSQNSPVKDLLGLVNLTEFYMEAGLNARETFRSDTSLEKLSEGKISRSYQPKVSDNFSRNLIKKLQEVPVNAGDSLFDIGCGSGSFLRTLLTMIPGLQLSGVDSNLFAIDKGKKQNHDFDMSGDITLLVGDITTDMDDFETGSYDWLTGINIFHFVPPDKRLYIIENMLRIAKKGIFLTQVETEKTPLSFSANALMFLLWQDFSGFFRADEIKSMNKYLMDRYGNHEFKQYEIMTGNSNMLAVFKS